MRLIVLVCISIVFAKACEEHKTCGACIRDVKACIWCEMDKFSETRCIPEKSAPPNWCTGHINNPMSRETDSVQEDFSSSSNYTIQIKPQKISMKLRPGQSIDFNFSYYAADHYPIDLYFLYHASMSDDVWKKLNEVPDEVFTFLKNMTNYVSVGFGTFIDKNKLPFMSVDNSTQAYSFQHHFTLSNDYDEFKKAKAGVRVERSIFNDDPEGGLDALAQVLACDDVGWRNISRKIVVFATDKSYHTAGDGSVAGIIYPYDGKCYLENGRYTKEQQMDYPSPGIINKLASDRDAIIIFVIKNEKKGLYEKLKEIINGARVIEPEPSYSQTASVVSELKTTYEEIIRVIKLKVNKKPIKYANKLHLSFDPECDKDKGCEVKQSSEYKITGKIKLLEYFEADNIEIDISIQGMKEKMTLYIEIIKDCECKTVKDDGDPQKCSGKGVRHCGVCECDSLSSGSRCECSTTNSTNYDRSTCIAPNALECNGRGSCICGSCNCSERYEGKFCECDRENCPRDKDGQICGNGDCHACSGECKCHANWSKTFQGICNCDNSKDACKTGPRECFDYGECKCNECKCPATICEWDARSSQDKRCRPLSCTDCHTRQCQLLEPYALNNIELNTACKNRVNVTSVKKLGNETSWMRCSDVRANVGCYTEFAYKYDEESYKVHVIVQSEYNCAESAYIYGGVCLGTLILGGILAIAIWKMVTNYRDTKEYKRFLEEHRESLEETQPLDNILYNSPFTSTNNPNYKRRSFR